MPYQPPVYNDVDFDFIVDAYTAPQYTGVNFVFGSFATQTFRHNQQWVTEIPESVRFNLNQQWGTYVIDSVEIRLTQQWVTNALETLNFKIDQQWATVAFETLIYQITQRWSVEAQENLTFQLTQQQSVDVISYVRWDVAQQWNTTSAADKFDITQRWDTVGVVSEKVDVTQQWTTNPVLLLLYQQNQRWVTNVPTNETFYHTQAWYFYYQVALEFQLLHGHSVSSSFEVKYDVGRTRVHESFVIQADIANKVYTEFVVNSPLSYVYIGFDVTYHLTYPVRMAFILQQDMISRVQQEFVLRQDIVAVNRVASEFTMVYSILGGSTQVNATEPTLTLNGQVIHLDEVDVSMDEEQFAWTCQVTLKNAGDYSLFNEGDAFTVDLWGETYSFIMDSKSLNRNGVASLSANISGISPSAALSSPRANPITKTWDTAVLASAVAAEVVGSYGISWEILDWSIPAFRLGVENQTPMEVLQLIAKAAGALVESDPDGSLYIRYEFPKSVTEYPTLTPDQTYTDSQHNFTLQEQFQTQKIENKLRVLDMADDARQDRVEFVQDEADHTRGYLKVFPSPWRETVTVDHTSLPSVSATYVGVITEDLEEIIEIVGGKGNVAKPIYSIQTVTWLYANLTGLTFDLDKSEVTSTHATNKESLVKINYRTRYLKFDVAAFSGAEVQFLVKDVTDG